MKVKNCFDRPKNLLRRHYRISHYEFFHFQPRSSELSSANPRNPRSRSEHCRVAAAYSVTTLWCHLPSRRCLCQDACRHSIYQCSAGLLLAESVRNTGGCLAFFPAPRIVSLLSRLPCAVLCTRSRARAETVKSRVSCERERERETERERLPSRHKISGTMGVVSCFGGRGGA